MIKSSDILPLAFPFFLVLLIIEILYTRHHSKNQYKFNDASTCIWTGIISFIIGLLGVSIKAYFYLYTFTYFKVFAITSLSTFLQILFVIALVFLQDLGYYWFHRSAHRNNFLWAGHIVHHSSEEYNLAVALRQSIFQQFTTWPFYLPLALIGYPPTWYLAAHSINLIYQYWIHTREINRMPAWFEAIFNTPSHHRVHHGTNKQYLDKNYAGIFIIWDKLFGTFEPEHEEVRYGITVPVNSHNPIWVNVHHYWYLIINSFRAPTLTEACKLWLAPPDWKPEWLADEPENNALQETD
jgi:alkylglycerol monooxygenase